MKLGATWFRAAAAAVALVSGLAFGTAQAQQRVVVQIGSGDFAEALKKAIIEPFEKETKIRVVTVPDFMSPAKLKLIVDNKSVDIDIVVMAWLHAIASDKAGMLEHIDYSLYDKQELASLDAVARQPYGVGQYYYSQVLGYNPKKFTDATRPHSWKEFWDVQKFPGARSFKSGVQGEGGYEEALLAAGVPADKLYPLDVERAFRSLERIKPHVKKWWRFGGEGAQIFADQAADFGSIYSGRVTNLQSKGVPVETEWNEGKLLLDFMLIPKGARNAANAQKFVAFASRAKIQADFSARMFYGPTNKKAFDHIDAKVAKQLSTYPDNAKKQFVRDDRWYAETDASGKTNIEKLIERWNRFTVD
jgi:putative spermidine/putrescine transport system substrate-binding protein